MAEQNIGYAEGFRPVTEELGESTSQQQQHFAGAQEEAAEVEQLCPSCKLIAILVYTSLSLVAFAGNALILAVFLAIGDLMISIFCIPLSYWHVLVFEDQRWVFGAFLCKIFNYLQATAVFLSSWTLVAISFDRFMAIQFPMSPWLKVDRRRALYAILGTWLFSLGMALPLLIVNQLSRSPEGVETCLEKWEDFFSAQFVSLYTSSLFALQYCLPLAVLLITYTAIGCKMWNSKVPGDELVYQQNPVGHNGRQTASCSQESIVPSGGCTKSRGSASTIFNQQKRPSNVSQAMMALGAAPVRRRSSVQRANVQQERKESVKKLIPMVLLVSALYAGCWLPQNLLMNIWVTYDPSILSHPHILYIWWCAHTLAMFHSVVNPFIYYATNRRIHAALKHLLRWLPCLRNARNSALAEFDAKKRASSFRYVSACSHRRTTIQKTMSASVDNE